MSVVAIARRYAEALADVALAHAEVERVDAEIGGFVALMRENRELYDVFASPVVSQQEKRGVLDAIISRIGVDKLPIGQADKVTITANLLRTLLSHYRLHHLAEVHEQFRRAINRRQGVALAEVTTAVSISSAEQETLSRKLQSLVGKRVEVRFKTDPSLIGGVVTRIESTIYDGSVRTQLDAVKQKLKEGTL